MNRRAHTILLQNQNAWSFGKVRVFLNDHGILDSAYDFVRSHGILDHLVEPMLGYPNIAGADQYADRFEELAQCTLSKGIMLNAIRRTSVFISTR